MDTNTKNALILAASTIGGAVGGRWAAPRLGAVLGLTLGPWGSAAGAAIGGVLGGLIANKMVGDVDFNKLEKPEDVISLTSE